jgi:lactate dehydrogenase-like 2-hydroxyacid dehydrogenase
MKKGVMIINTSRGAVIDTQAVIVGLKNGRIGHLGLDVYEEELDRTNGLVVQPGRSALVGLHWEVRRIDRRE